MRIRNTPQPIAPRSARGGKSGIKPKSGNTRGARGALTTKKAPVDGKPPLEKSGNLRSSRGALGTKSFPVGPGDHFQGLGNVRARRPDAIKPQGVAEGRERDAFEVQPRTPIAVRPGGRDTDVNVIDGPTQPHLPEDMKKIGGGNNLGKRDSIGK